MPPLKYLLFLLLLISVSACNKDVAVSPAFVFTSNGSAVSGNNYTATYNVNAGTGVYNFTGNFYESNSRSYVQLIFSSSHYIALGAYQPGNAYPNNTSGNLYLYIDSAQFESEAGSFQITQLDTVNHKISGTFQFSGVNVLDAYQTVTVSNGSFTNIGYTVQ